MPDYYVDNKGECKGWQKVVYNYLTSKKLI